MFTSASPTLSSPTSKEASAHGTGRGTWSEHVKILTDLRFIDTRQVGNRKVGYVLLPNPLAVARWHYEEKRTPGGWWVSFKSRAREIGAEMPEAIDESLFAEMPARVARPVRKKEPVAQATAETGETD